MLISVRDAYLKKANWLHIKKRCAARIVRRIVADEVHLLPQQVLLSGCYDTIAAMVYNCIEKAPMPLTDNTKKEFFNYLAGNLDISGIFSEDDVNNITSLDISYTTE